MLDWIDLNAMMATAASEGCEWLSDSPDSQLDDVRDLVERATDGGYLDVGGEG